VVAKPTPAPAAPKVTVATAAADRPKTVVQPVKKATTPAPQPATTQPTAPPAPPATPAANKKRDAASPAATGR
jgi:hypothetical protein